MPENDTWLRRTVEQHDRDLYRGNGLPGITTRLKSLEDDMESIHDLLRDLKKSRDTKANLILGGIITLLAGLLLAHLKII